MSTPRNGELTIKQRKFVAETIKTGNPTRAILNVYDTVKQDVARSMASENLAKPSIKEAIEEGLRVAGLTPDSVFNTLKANMIAGEKVKATASDSNTAAKIILDTYKLLDRSQSGGTMGITVQVDGLSKTDLIDARRKLTAKWNNILGE